MARAGRPATRPVDETTAALGRTIQVLRTEQGVSRRELADASRLSYPYLSEIERGTKRASTKSLEAIAAALGVRAADLLAAADERAAGVPTSPGHRYATSVALPLRVNVDDDAARRSARSWSGSLEDAMQPSRDAAAAPGWAARSSEPRSAIAAAISKALHGLDTDDLRLVLELVQRLRSSR